MLYLISKAFYLRHCSQISNFSLTSEPKLNLEINTNQNKQWDATFQKMSWWDSKKIADAKVMVVGAGALGNEVLKNLALLNVGHILIVDFDLIEYGNLSRSVLFRESDCDKQKAEVAAKAIKIINPNVKVQYISGDIAIDVGLGIFRRMDVVIGCLDNRIARLFINRHCYKVGKTWVDGAIENLGGQLDVFKPFVSCYECQLSEQERQIIRYRLGCADVARRNANFGSIPTTPISSSIIGAMQVQEALKIIYDNEKESMSGHRFLYFGRSNDFFMSKSAPIKEECDSHILYEPIIEAGELSCKLTIKEVLGLLKNYFEDATVKILLDEEIVLEVVSSESELVSELVILKGHLSEEVAGKYKQTPEEELMIKESLMVIDDTFPYPDLSLNNVGIPPLQILKVEANQDIYFVELTGDESFINFE